MLAVPGKSAALGIVVVLRKLSAPHRPASPCTLVAPRRLVFPDKPVALERLSALVWWRGLEGLL